MTEFIGSRISLISKRDIRYVGTLHEISSENSTVALENVTSYGTEGRRPDEEIAPNLDNVYEYIVFRGSDVKDLRIEEAPKEAKRPEPPKVPDDPAILGSTRKPKSAVGQPPQSTSTPDTQFQIPPPIQSRNSQQDQNHNQNQNQHQGQNQGPFHNQNRSGPPPFQGHPFPLQPFQYGMPSPGHRFEPGPFPPGAPGPGFPGGPFGAPPGWYPPYGGPPHMHGQFHPHHMSVGPPGAPEGPQGPPPVSPPALEAVADDKTPAPKTPSKEGTPAPAAAAQASAPPVDSKPDETTADPVISEAKPEPPAVKHNRLIPAVPLSPAVKNATALNGTRKQVIADTSGKPGPAKSIEDANRDARAAVAAAMAKLPAADKRSAENGTANIENVTKAVGELRTSENRGRGRGYRGGYRGGRGDSRRVDVPKVDFDFESSNAKFNKQDLVKEAIANGSPVGTPAGTPDGIEGHEKRGSEAGISIPTGTGYNKSSSFFDDISSEIKDRAESKDGGQRLGGKEFRNEERQKNLETFGQGSVDNFKYGRGRGRGRGYSRGRGRGSYNQNGRGGAVASRGNRDGTTAVDS